MRLRTGDAVGMGNEQVRSSQHGSDAATRLVVRSMGDPRDSYDRDLLEPGSLSQISTLTHYSTCISGKPALACTTYILWSRATCRPYGQKWKGVVILCSKMMLPKKASYLQLPWIPATSHQSQNHLHTPQNEKTTLASFTTMATRLHSKPAQAAFQILRH